ncbi:pentapeptide repeat protein [Spirosoma oryzae]|uniref:Pentapeptide repeat protein n=1 Tax=Spirosoma oryzae TaxID=1469603 RepID=A0A2T0T590_9BACT|nr:pentapeptide repeat-containing protein [Spirosoma oryzae]PRY40836.1 pentapeptide repeat protein [Spirosoma oryzae]
MKTIQIKHRYTGDVLFEHSAEDNNLILTIREGIRQNANLRGANLSGANLSGANLSGANLSGADLSDADLSGADLSGANLSGADLSDADLSGADLSGADLSDADLRGADLSDADLSGADLRTIKHDLFAVLLYAIHEVPGLLSALKEGRVNGSVYSGDCACLVGTLCNVRQVSIETVKLSGMPVDSSSPIERWFLAIKPGETPDNSPIVKLTVEWIDEFIRLTGVTPAHE